ncbi:MAG: hypothetical protein HFE75_16375 [Firmicutes bacterium]|nr:hypothetical protein [Bacillota bacterium]
MYGKAAEQAGAVEYRIEKIEKRIGGIAVTMLTDNQKHILIESIKQLPNPSELEKDILDTLEEISRQSLNMNHAQARITLTYKKHIDLYAKVSALPTTVQKTSNQISEMDLRYILQMQLNFLLEKEQEERYHG